MSYTVSTINQPLLLPTSSVRTQRSTSASRLSSTRPVQSTRRRMLPHPSLVVCRVLPIITIQIDAHSSLQLFPTSATPSSIWNLGSSRSNRQFILHILPIDPAISPYHHHKRRMSVFLIPTTKCDLTYAPDIRHDHRPTCHPIYRHTTQARKKKQSISSRPTCSVLSMPGFWSPVSRHHTCGF